MSSRKHPQRQTHKDNSDIQQNVLGGIKTRGCGFGAAGVVSSGSMTSTITTFTLPTATVSIPPIQSLSPLVTVGPTSLVVPQMEGPYSLRTTNGSANSAFHKLPNLSVIIPSIKLDEVGPAADNTVVSEQILEPDSQSSVQFCDPPSVVSIDSAMTPEPPTNKRKRGKLMDDEEYQDDGVMEPNDEFIIETTDRPTGRGRTGRRRGANTRKPMQPRTSRKRRKTDAKDDVEIQIVEPNKEIVDLDDMPDEPNPLEIMCPRKASLRSAKQYRDELKVCVYPGMDNPNAVTITNADLERLRPNELLNDTIIDFYLMYIRENLMRPELRSKFFFFNSFFYRKLVDSGYEHVKKWTRNVNIFDYEYIIVPINQEYHWRLAVVCNCHNLKNSPDTLPTAKLPFIIIFDSLTPDDQKRPRGTCPALKEYFDNEAKEKKITLPKNFSFAKMTVRRPRVPQQENSTDCGLFVLQYAECFVERPLTVLNNRTFQLEIAKIMNFTPKNIAKKREAIKNIILQLSQSENFAAL